MSDSLERFTPASQEVLRFAQMEATRMHHATIGPEHILLGLLLESEGLAGRVLRDMGMRPQQVQRTVERLSSAMPLRNSEPELQQSTKVLLQMAVDEARRRNSSVVDTQHILLSLLRQQEGLILAILAQFGLTSELLRRRIDQFTPVHSAQQQQQQTQGPSGNPAKTDPRRGGQPSLLDQLAIDLTEQARQGKLDPVIGRQKEIERVIQILARRSKNNPALIGQPGVGKTAIVEGLAQRIVAGEVPGPIMGKRVVQLDIGSLVAGTMYRGQFEERLKKVVDELRGSNTITFIDEVHMLVGAGAAGSSVDAANILKPALSRGELQCIGATTLEEYRKYIEADAALERRFQPVMVDEPGIDETIEILRGVKYAYEQHHKVRISDSALESAVRLSARYVTERYMPDKAIDAIDEAASRVRMYKSPIAVRLRESFERLQGLRLKRARLNAEGEYGNEMEALEAQEQALEAEMEHLRRLQESESGLTVESEDIAEIIAMWTGIPVSQIAQEESRRLLAMESELRKRIIGQEEAISLLARAVRRSRAGLKDPRRPIGSFIFLGPTGVGKTELAKTLAAFLFGSEEALIQLDMSEFMERHTVARLVGAPPGYVGYDDAGQLTEAVRRRPYSIIVFDEIEKAHPDAFNMLLQVMEEGSLSDAKGHKVDFRNTIIIMTTNVGAEEIHRRSTLGFSLPSSQEPGRAFDEMKRRLLDELRKLFKPEFINRVDDVIVFHGLGMAEIRQIVQLEVDKVRERLHEQGIELTLTEAGQDWLAEHGYNEEYGARPLRRLIQQEVETPLSEMLLAEGMTPGVAITVDVEESALVLRRLEQPAGVGKP